MRGFLRELKNEVPDDNGLPTYEIENAIVGPQFYSLKVFYGGAFDENFEHYTGGKYAYIDYILRPELSMSVLEEIVEELGVEKGSFVIWFQIPETELHNNTLMTLESNFDVETLGPLLIIVVYSHCIQLLVMEALKVLNMIFLLFNMNLIRERERRVDEIREECEKKTVPIEAESGAKNTGDEHVPFFGDTSNLDSTESEAPAPANVGPLGIEAESYVGKHHEQFTSLRNLENARLKRQKQLGKKKN